MMGQNRNLFLYLLEQSGIKKSATLLLSLFLFFFHISASIAQELEEGGRVERAKKRMENRIVLQRQLNMMQADPRTGKVPKNARRREMAFHKRLQNSQDLRINPLLNLGIDNWRNRGPFNIGGRTRQVVIDWSNESRIVAAVAFGGVWLSEDDGRTWTKTTGLESIQNASCLVQDPNNANVWYYGTGELYGGLVYSDLGLSALYHGHGIFKSVDGARTWTPLESTRREEHVLDFTFDYNSRLVISPATGDLFVSNIEGVHRSSDGGESWDLILDVFDGEIFTLTDVACSPSGILYATAGNLAEEGMQGIYISFDNGDTWNEIAGNRLPESSNRIVIDINKGNESIVHFLYENTTDDTFGLLRLIVNDGLQWSDLTANLPNNNSAFRTQMGYNMIVRTKPDNPNVIFVGGQNLFRSTNGFLNNTQTKMVGGYHFDGEGNIIATTLNQHADHHDITFYPSNPNRMLSATDGGIFRSENSIENAAGKDAITWTDLNRGFFSTDAIGIGIDYQNLYDDKIVAGFQDNHTLLVNGNATEEFWKDILGGDGGYCAIAQGGRYIYGTSFGAGIFARTELDANGNTIGFSLLKQYTPFQEAVPFYPFVLDPNNDAIAYFPFNNRVVRNDNVHASADLSESQQLNNVRGTNGQVITAMALSRQNPSNRLYFASYGGKVYRVDNAHQNNAASVEITGPDFPDLDYAYVSCIKVDPKNANNVFVVYSNYQVPSVFHSTDGGTTWTEVGGNLEVIGQLQNGDNIEMGPAIKWLEIVRAGNNTPIYLLGTSIGVYSTTNINGMDTEWTQVSPDIIGNVPVYMIKSRQDGYVVVATHGNGMFSTYLGTDDHPPLVENKIDDITVFVGEQNQLIDLNNVFMDPDGDNIALEIVSNSNQDLVDLAIQGNNLVLDFLDNQIGTADIALSATSNGKTIKELFKVTVLPLNENVLYNQSDIGESIPNIFVGAGTYSDINLGMVLDNVNVPLNQIWRVGGMYVDGLNIGQLNIQSFEVSFWNAGPNNSIGNRYNIRNVPVNNIEVIEIPRYTNTYVEQIQSTSYRVTFASPVLLPPGATWIGFRPIYANASGIAGGRIALDDNVWLPIFKSNSFNPPYAHVGDGVEYSSVDQDLSFSVLGNVVGTQHSIPQNLRASVENIREVHLRWNDVQDAVKEQGYYIERKAADGVYEQIAAVQADVTQYIDRGADIANAIYFYRIRTFGGMGTSGYSNEVQVEIDGINEELLEPANLTYTSTTNSITLEWDDVALNAQNYALVREPAFPGGVAKVADQRDSHTDEDLIEGTRYYYRVYSYRGEETSETSNIIAFTKPETPTNPNAELVFDQDRYTTRISWENNSASATQYSVARAIRNAQGNFGNTGFMYTSMGQNLTELIGEGTDSPVGAPLVPVEELKTYRFIIYAQYVLSQEDRDATGSRVINSGASQGVVLTIPLFTPRDFRASAVDRNTITLEWEDYSLANENYLLVVNGDVANAIELGADASSYVFNVNPQVVNYNFELYATANGGGSESEHVSIQVEADFDLGTPINLVAVYSDGNVNLTWEDESDNENGFLVYRSVDGGNFGLINNVPIDAEAYSDDVSRLDELVSVVYFVEAYIGADPSSPDNVSQRVVSQEVILPMKTPTDLVVDLFQNNPRVTWTDNSSVDAGYEIYMRADGALYDEPVATLEAGDPGQNVYIIENADFQLGVAHFFKVVALQPGGFGNEYRQESEEVSLDAVNLEQPVITDMVLSQQGQFLGQLSIAWQHNFNMSYAYRLLRSSDNGVNYIQIGEDFEEGARGYSDNTVIEGETYLYKVVVLFENWEVESDEVEFVMPFMYAATNLRVTASASDFVQLAWVDNSRVEEGYNIYRSENGGPMNILDNVGANMTTYRDERVRASTFYEYTVIPSRDGRAFGSSNIVGVLTGELEAPEIDEVVFDSPTEIDLSWGIVAQANGYKVYRSLIEGVIGNEVGVIMDGDVDSFIDINPGRYLEKTTYFYSVVAILDDVESIPSEQVGVVTPALFRPLNLEAILNGNNIELSWQNNSVRYEGYIIERSEDGNVFAEIARTGRGTFDYTDIGINIELPYVYRVRAFRNDGDLSVYSNSARVSAGELIAPSNLDADYVEYGRITVVWLDNSSREEGYRLYRSVNNGVFELLRNLPVNATNFVDFAIAENTNYSYYVEAFRNGQNPMVSNEDNTNTPPIYAPINLVGTVNANFDVRLVWTDRSKAEDTYRVYRNGEVLADIGAQAGDGQALYIDNTALEGMSYTYFIEAEGNGVTKRTNQIQVVVGIATPNNLSVNFEENPNRIQLDWEHQTNAQNVRYEIFRSQDMNQVGVLIADIDARAYSDEDIIEGARYYYRVRAVESSTLVASAYVGPNLETVVDLFRPTNLEAILNGAGGASLTWNDASLRNNKYQIFRRTEGNAYDFNNPLIVIADANSFVDNGIQDGETYYYQVRAINDEGNLLMSELSNEASLSNEDLVSPSGLEVNFDPDNISVNLNWVDNAIGEDGYVIYRSVNGGNLEEIGRVGANITVFIDNNIDEATSYVYFVYGLDNGAQFGEAGPANIDISLFTPTGLVGNVNAGFDVDLAWNDNSSAEQAYVIYRSEDANMDANEELTTVGANSTVYTDATALEGRTYYYAVRARSGDVLSGWSNIIEVNIGISAPSISNITYDDPDPRVELTWNANNAATGYVIYRSENVNDRGNEVERINNAASNSYTDRNILENVTYFYSVKTIVGAAESEFSQAARISTDIFDPTGLVATSNDGVSIDLTWNDNSVVANAYEIWRSQSAQEVGVLLETVMNGNLSTYNDPTVDQGVTYVYRVRAIIDGADQSDYSDPAAGNTEPIVPPSGLDVTPGGPDIMFLSWNDNSDEETGFEIYRDGNLIHTINQADITEFEDNTEGLEEGTRYSYKVLAISGMRKSEESNTASAFTMLIAATELTAEVLDASRISLTWSNNSTKATKYEIHRKDTQTGDYRLITMLDGPFNNEVGFTDTNLASNTTYYYVVFAVNDDTSSHASNSANGTTGVLGIEGVDLATQIKLYPNPTSDKFKIEVEGYQGSGVVEIYDISGKFLMSEGVNIGSEGVEMDITSLSGGKYILRLVTDKGEVRLSLIKN